MGISGRPITSSRTTAAALVLVSVLVAPMNAHAQATPQELAAARQLFNEGKELEKQRSYGAALEKFKKVAGVKMTPQVRFHIALCEENLGHLVEAINGFELAGDEAKRAGSSATEVAENAPGRAAALRQRVPTLRLDVTGKLLTSRVLLDGAPVAATMFGVAMPVDPGDHAVEVQDAAGKATFHRDLTLGEKATEGVDIAVHDVEVAAIPMITPKPSPPPPPPPTPPSRAPVILAGSIGVASLIASGVFYGLRAGTLSTVAAGCRDPVNYTGCTHTQALDDAAENGHTYSTVSAVTFGVGLAALGVAGALWFLTGPKRTPAPARASIVLVPAGRGVALRGAF